MASKKPAKSSQKSHGLGRGFGALLGNEPISDKQPLSPVKTINPKVIAQSSQLQKGSLNAVNQIPVSDIERSPWQPRQTFDDLPLNELAESIKRSGIIQPLICRRKTNGLYELIAGERRLRAAQLANLKTVPVVLVEAEDAAVAEMAIVENIQREDLNCIEEAEGYRTLYEVFKLSHQEIAERVGKARSSITNILRLNELPDQVKQMLLNRQITEGHARALLALPTADQQVAFAGRVIERQLSVRTLERLVQEEIQPQPTEKKTATPDMPTSHVRDLTDRLYHHFGTAIRLKSSSRAANGMRTKGVLEIDFSDNEDLDRILNLIGIKVD